MGLSACHILPEQLPHPNTSALEHKLSAIQALGELLSKEECSGLDPTEEDLTLSIVLLLLLQDVSGVCVIPLPECTYGDRFVKLECLRMGRISTALSSCVLELSLVVRHAASSERSCWRLYRGESSDAWAVLCIDMSL